MTDLFYVAGNYGATGEGVTISLLVTRAYPDSADYKVDNNVTPSDKIALREFKEVFGDYFGSGGEILTKEQFFAVYAQMVPSAVTKAVDANAGNITWFTQLHINYG